MNAIFSPSVNFDAMVSAIELAVVKVDYRTLCDTLVSHAVSVGYTGKAFNRNYNTNNVKRWCKAESSDGRLQYILAGCGKDSRRGRVTVLAQWDFFCQCNMASQTILRGLKDNPAIVAGLARMYPKGDSSWGTLEGRQAATLVSSADLTVKQKEQAAKQVTLLNSAKVEGNRAAYSHSMDALAKLLEASAKRNAKTPAPAVTKPVQTETPAVTKPAKRKGKGAVA